MGTSMKSFNQIFLSAVVILSLAFTSVSGQTNFQVLEKAKYITWVKPINDSPIMKGYLYDVGDDHVLMLSSTKTETVKFNFKDIEKIEFRNDGRIILGAVIGGVIGGIAFGITDHRSNQSSSKPNLTGVSFDLGLGPLVPIFGATVGALFGGIIGSIKISKPINGNPQYQKEKLMKYKLIY
jgi:hypothetical protein